MTWKCYPEGRLRAEKPERRGDHIRVEHSDGAKKSSLGSAWRQGAKESVFTSNIRTYVPIQLTVFGGQQIL